MYVVDLKCGNGHSFEGWYEDRTEYQTIVHDGDLTCPLCETSNVERVYTTGDPQTSKTRDRQERRDEIPEYEYVGTRFYDTVNAMKAGQVPMGSVAGIATESQIEELEADGVAIDRLAPLDDYIDDTEIN